MIIDLVFGLGFLALGTLVGCGWSIYFFKNSQPMRIWIFGQLTGIGISIVVAAWLVFLESNISYLLPIVTLIGALGWVIASKGKIHRFNLVELRPGSTFFATALTGLTFAFLCNRTITQSRFAYRVGPDFFGWSTSSKYFCTNENLIPLSKRISTFLDGTPFRDSLLTPVPAGGKSLWQISSFTDQVNAEFLLQANRLGIQSTLGGFCRIFDATMFSHLMIGMAIWSVASAVLILIHFTDKLSSSPRLILSYSVLGVLNFSLLSVVLEGGYGQLILTPFFLIFVSFLIFEKPYSRELNVTILLLLSVALVAYIDVLLLVAPIIAIYFFIYLLKKGKFNYSRIKPMILTLISASIIGFPGLPNAINTIVERFMRPTFGGWDQGNLPLPANLFGLVPWLPHGLYERIGISFFTLVPSIVLTLFILARVIMIESKKISSLFISMLLVYLLLFLSVYMSGDSDTNNYRVWKFGAYLAALSPYLFLADLKVKGNKNYSLARTIVIQINRSIPILLILSSIFWTLDWLNTSKMTLNERDSKLVSLYSIGHDLQIINMSAAMFTMYGDIKYGASIRNFGVKTDKTFSNSRTLLIIPSKSDCGGSICSHLPPDMLDGKSVKIVARGQDIDIIKLVPIRS